MQIAYILRNIAVQKCFENAKVGAAIVYFYFNLAKTAFFIKFWKKQDIHRHINFLEIILYLIAKVGRICCLNKLKKLSMHCKLPPLLWKSVKN